MRSYSDTMLKVNGHVWQLLPSLDFRACCQHSQGKACRKWPEKPDMQSVHAPSDVNADAHRYKWMTYDSMQTIFPQIECMRHFLQIMLSDHQAAPG